MSHKKKSFHSKVVAYHKHLVQHNRQHFRFSTIRSALKLTPEEISVIKAVHTDNLCIMKSAKCVRRSVAAVNGVVKTNKACKNLENLGQPPNLCLTASGAINSTRSSMHKNARINCDSSKINTSSFRVHQIVQNYEHPHQTPTEPYINSQRNQGFLRSTSSIEI